VSLGVAAGPLDTAVNIAFPAITAAFVIPVTTIQWVVICYVLTYGSLLLGCGRLGDVIGHKRVFLFANISFMLCMMALFAPGFLMPFYFEQLRGFSTVETGLLLTPLSITFALVAPFSGALADRFGSRWLSPTGLAIACFGLFLLSQVNAQSSLFDIIWRLIIIGIGQGIFQSPNTRTIMGAAPHEKQGEASGLLATGRVIGQSLSVALIGTVFAAFGGAIAGNLLFTQAHTLSPAKVTTLQATFVNSFHAGLLVCAAFAAIGIFTAIARGKQ